MADNSPACTRCEHDREEHAGPRNGCLWYGGAGMYCYCTCYTNYPNPSQRLRRTVKSSYKNRRWALREIIVKGWEEADGWDDVEEPEYYDYFVPELKMLEQRWADLAEAEAEENAKKEDKEKA